MILYNRIHPLSRIWVMAISVAVMLSACSSDEIEGTGVKKEDVGKGVATQFALNIGRSPGNSTRQTSFITQNGMNFRGMDNIYLIPMSFRQAKSGILFAGGNAFAGPNQTFTNSTVYDTPWTCTIFPLGAISTSEISGSNSNKVYSLTLPVGTNNFLFYGKAPRYSMPTPYEENALNGKLNLSVSGATAKADEIYAELSTITDDYTTPETALLGILNALAGISGWSTLGMSDVRYSRLYAAYMSFVGDVGSVRSGSAESIRATIQRLYRVVLDESRHGSDDGVKTLAMNIRRQVENDYDVYFDKTADDHNVFEVLVASDDIDVDADNDGVYDHDAAVAYLMMKSSYSKLISDFPASIGLPSGAAYLSFNSSGKFEYVNSTQGLVVSSTQDLDNLVYPAELTYFANSGLRATDLIKTVTDYPNTINVWDTPGSWADWTQTAVGPATLAVAMKNNVNYGVAMLKSTLDLGEASFANSLQDNRAEIVGDGITANQTIPIGPESFIVTGVIVSGQPNRVGWDFLPTGDGFDKLVYDRKMNNVSATGATAYFDEPEYPIEAYDKSTTKKYNYVPWTAAEAKANYTLLLDNYNPEALDKVKVVLELINNTGMDFYGKDGLIPAGGTFYLLGELDPDAAALGSSIDWTSYTAQGNTDYTDRFPAYQMRRVFVQDHTTVANFSLSYSALQNAYNTIPDEKTIEIQMVFGLSVDLQWLRGLEFNVPI